MPAKSLTVELQPKQRRLLRLVDESPATWIGYGGSRGGAKSYGIDAVMLIRRMKYAATSGCIMRRTFDLVPEAGLRLTPKHYAYLKISEGCNNRCSFCIIPQIRGDLGSRPLASVLYEAERLVKSGVKEIMVISQDTSAYGVDLN